MRILYVTHGFPYPLTSGRLRHYHLLRELSARHVIALVVAARPDFLFEHAAAIEPFTERLEVIPWQKTGRKSKVPWAEMRTAVEQVLRQRPYDVVFSSMGSYPALARLDLPPVVVDVCDANLLYQRGRMRHAPWLSRPRLWLHMRGLARLERRVIASADHLTFISARDRDAVLGSCQKPNTIVTNGVDLDFWRRSSDELGRRTIVFTGTMKYPPNDDAARVLLADILPRVQRAVADAKLLIVGRNPTQALLRAAAGRPGVTVTGFVPDVRPYLELASLSVAPIRFGAGVQNKMLEAMAMGVPVIATPLVAAGLTTPDGERAPLSIADNSEQFVDQICKALLRDRRTPDVAGRQFVAEHFDWARSAQRLQGLLEGVAPKLSSRST